MSGLDYEDWLHRKIWKKRQIIEGRLVRTNLFRDNYVKSVDVGIYTTTYILARTPGRLRNFFRKLRLDRSTWKFKIVKTEVIRNGKR